MSKIISDNRNRWNDLAHAGAVYSVPFLEFSIEQAREHVCRYNVIDKVENLNVLCLGGGGGQDSIAFGILGANVAVLDLSDEQLNRDKKAALHHGLKIQTIQGDMNDLSMFDESFFDIVWQPYSINYSPTVQPVFREVMRVLKNGGIYYVAFANPFAMTIKNESWNGVGYLFQGSYTDGEDISKYQSEWSIPQQDGSIVNVDAPHQFRHTVSTVLNTLSTCGFTFLLLQERMRSESHPEPGSWIHLTQVAPPWFDSFWQLHKPKN
jgi:SAM-dependent methyltransferase